MKIAEMIFKRRLIQPCTINVESCKAAAGEICLDKKRMCRGTFLFSLAVSISDQLRVFCLIPTLALIHN